MGNLLLSKIVFLEGKIKRNCKLELTINYFA